MNTNSQPYLIKTVREEPWFKKAISSIFIISALMHIFLLFFFKANGIIEMQVFNYFSPFIFIFCIFLTYKDKTVLASFLGLGEATVHGFVSTVLLGWGSGFSYYIILAFLLIFIMYRLSILSKLLVAVPISLVFVSLFLYTSSNLPKYELSSQLLTFLHILNILIMLIVICIFIILYTYFIRKMENNMRENLFEMKVIQENLEFRIIENKTIQESLYKEKTLLDAILDNLPDSIYFKDRESRFTRMSKSMLRLFNVSRIEEMIGKTDFDFHEKQAAQKFKDDEEKIIATNIAIIDNLQHEHLTNGVVQWVSTTKLPLKDEKGETIGTFGISKDVTYLKHLEIEAKQRAAELQAQEEELRKKEEQQRLLNQQKIKFFSIFSHDLKNPLNAVAGFTSLLWENYDKYSEERKRKMLGDMAKLMDNLKILILNLLDWSKSQLNNLSVNPTKIFLKEVINETILLYEFQQTQKQIEVTVHTDDTDFVIADSNILQTVIRNLYSNALKYCNPGGKITIRFVRDTEEVRIMVIDNGIGISKSDLENLLTFKGDASRPGTMNEKGTGLGLIVCKEYIEKCNGSLSIKSEPEKGSTFTIHLPIIQESVPA